MSKYKIVTLSGFDRDYKKLKKNPFVSNLVKKILHKLLEDPFDYSLRTHMVTIPFLGNV